MMARGRLRAQPVRPGLAPGIERRRRSAERRDMREVLDAGLAHCHGQVLRAQSIHGIKALRPASQQDSDEVDDRVSRSVAAIESG